MIVTADARKFVFLPGAQPGDSFDIQIVGDGKLILTRVKPSQGYSAEVTVENRTGFSVGILDRPIDEQALAEALNDFP
jgi:hypothetical protein